MPTTIEWTRPPWVHGGESWNPIYGCSPVHAGCANCYAAAIATRFANGPEVYRGLTTANGHWTGTVNLADHRLMLPFTWKKPTGVFVASMSDPFHKSVPDYYRDNVFAIMALTPQHTYFVLTKRIQEAREYLIMERRIGSTAEAIEYQANHLYGTKLQIPRQAADWVYDITWPLPNVWILYSASTQKDYDESIPYLVKTPAAVIGLSLEPLLEPIRLGSHLPRLGWVIIGGESGRRARPMREEWVRDIINQCNAAGVPVFYKQRMDENGKLVSLPTIDGKQYVEWPTDRRRHEPGA